MEEEEEDLSSYWMTYSKVNSPVQNSLWKRQRTCCKTGISKQCMAALCNCWKTLDKLKTLYCVYPAKRQI